jgi:Maltogenic Amylase, C-terminal domain
VLLNLKGSHPALFQNGSRRMIHTSDEHAYAILRDSVDHSERLLLVFNFRASSADIRVDTAAVHASRYVEITTSTASQPGSDGLTVTLLAHGYQIFAVS